MSSTEEWLKTNQATQLAYGQSGKTKKSPPKSIRETNKVNLPRGPALFLTPEWSEIKRLWDEQELMWNKNVAKNRSMSKSSGDST